MEKGPEIRIVGSASEEEKNRINQEHKKMLVGENHLDDMPDDLRKEMEKDEISKTKEQLMIFDYANKETNRLLEKFGIEPYDIPEKNFHMISRRLIRELTGKDTDAISFLQGRVALVDKDFSKKVLFLPQFHFMSCFTLRVISH